MPADLSDPLLTFGANLVWEVEQPALHEFFAGEVFEMPAARATHNTIAGDVFAVQKQALRGTPARVFISEMTLHAAAADASFNPDVFVGFDPRDRVGDAELVQRQRVRVVEVLSDSTAAFDRGQKFETYRKLDSLMAYRVVEQHRPHADLFLRKAGGLWVLNSAGVDQSLTLALRAIALLIAAVYDGADFRAPTPPGQPSPSEEGRGAETAGNPPAASRGSHDLAAIARACCEVPTRCVKHVARTRHAARDDVR